MDTELSHKRHDISNKLWGKLEGHLPGRRVIWGGIAKDNRTFINAVMWIFRTGAPWTTRLWPLEECTQEVLQVA